MSYCPPGKSQHKPVLMLLRSSSLSLSFGYEFRHAFG